MGDWAEEFDRAQDVAEMEEWIDDGDEEKSLQNLPKADVYSLLAEVRALKIDKPEYFTAGSSAHGYNQAIDDVLKKISEHFNK